MSISVRSRCVGAVAVAVAAVTMTAGGAYAQDTAYVPFRVNADATVKAKKGGDSASISVTKDIVDTLKLPLGSSSSVRYGDGAQGRTNAPMVTGSRGNITLRLPAQSYQNAEVALYSINGKRVLRGKAAASETASAILRRNVAAGVYLLSVKGINGSAFSTRLNHSGGNININAAFGNENAAHEKPLAKQAAAGNWEITVSAIVASYVAKYEDSTYTLNLTVGEEYALQDIALREKPLSDDEFIDARDGKNYRWVEIGTQKWMAENLNYDVPDDTTDVCFKNEADSCAIYGRLYNWEAAMNGASGSSSNPSGVRGVCPADWHLPSDAEWTVLTDYVGGASTAGTKLKSAAKGWRYYDYSIRGTDDYGFSALGGGWGDPLEEIEAWRFLGGGGYGLWWSTTTSDDRSAAYWNMSSHSANVNRAEHGRHYLISVRCVKD